MFLSSRHLVSFQMTCLREEAPDWVPVMTSPDEARSYWAADYWVFLFYLKCFSFSGVM